MKVVVFGMGYVGCVTAAVLAREGHHVTGVDPDTAKLTMLSQGQSPVLEPGLPELVRRGQLAGRLRATSDAGEALAQADVIIICVGTPSTSSGGLDSVHLERVCEEIGAGIGQRADFPVVLLRSTVLPYAIETVVVATLERASGKRVGKGFGLVVNPEFLREGSSIEDFDKPQFTLLGTEDQRSPAIAQRLYGFLKAPVIVTDRRSAALVKYACNAFHATKVAFANEIGALGEALGVDGREVMRILCLDTKLNVAPAYLRPGMPFGGSCLPKDIRAMLHYARRQDVGLPLLDGVLASNQRRTMESFERIMAHGRARIGIFGLAFKSGTDDLRESPTVAIVEALIGKGKHVAIYDRRVSLAHLLGANRTYVEQHLPHIASILRPTLEQVLEVSDLLVVTNGDDEFRRIPEMMRPDQELIDLTRSARHEPDVITAAASRPR
jgi:GDP-mannose 6-dehydrogenase